MPPEIQTTLTVSLQPWMLRALIVAGPLIVWLIIYQRFSASEETEDAPWLLKAILSGACTMLSFVLCFAAYAIGLWIVYG